MKFLWATMFQYDLVTLSVRDIKFAAMIKSSKITDNEATIGIVSNNNLGGMCVNVGYVPSKYLLEVSNRYFYSNKNLFQKVKLPGEINFKELTNDLRQTIVILGIKIAHLKS